LKRALGFRETKLGNEYGGLLNVKMLVVRTAARENRKINGAICDGWMVSLKGATFQPKQRASSTGHAFYMRI
jgi:hypothetical protein